jgi:putative DNA primase/helicase
MQACRLPAWAAISSTFMEALVLPDVVREIIILADNDRNGAGQRSAARAARRWVQEDRRVRIALPPEVGVDFNDILTGCYAAEAHHAR